MWCCSECFSSSYLKGIIGSNGKIDNCDFCGSKDVLVCDPNELSLFFQAILDLYAVNERTGGAIEDQIEKDFGNKIFSIRIIGNRRMLLAAIISKEQASYKQLFENKVAIECLNDVSKVEQVKPLQLSWDNFAKEIRSTNRFHIQNVLDLDKLKTLLGRYEKHIIKGNRFYRARISSEAGFSVTEMANPIPEKAKAGRANPLGISYLYLADQAKTALYEVRATLYDYVSIGEFEVIEELRVINLRGDSYDPIFLADQDALEDFLIHLPFISKLEVELSKPRRRSDNELDYLPTQYLSEFIKSIGFDGVEFQSSLYSKGYNLAIFKSASFHCNSVDLCEIQSIDLQHKVIKSLSRP